MSELERLRERVEAARRELAAAPALGRGRPGPPDEVSGERWDRANVLGHTAEMLPFWTARVREALAGAPSIGRGEGGYQERRKAIDGAAAEAESELRSRIDAGAAGLLALLGEMREADLGRRLRYRRSGGERELDLREALDELLVGHLEAHLRQLRSLEE